MDTDLLVRLLCPHYDDAVAAFQRLERNLANVELPFDDLYAQFRELEFPAQPCLPNGMPSFIYYFVPNSGWGSHNAPPIDPLDSTFVGTGDGIGMNFGCPVRLARALDALNGLKPEDQEEVKKELKAPNKHLAIVEELLWLNGWKARSDAQRGGRLVGGSNVDWFLTTHDFPLYLESKFRPSDWARLSDQGTFQSVDGGLLKNAAKKFPIIPKDGALHIVGITGPASLTEEFVHDFGRELETYPQIHGIIYRAMTQMTHVISLHAGVVERLLHVIAQPSIRDFPTNYIVNWHIKQRNERVKQREALPPRPKANAVSKAICSSIQPRFDARVVVAPEGAYNANIKSRRDDGEPTFIAIPKEIWVKDDGKR